MIELHVITTVIQKTANVFFICIIENIPLTITNAKS